MSINITTESLINLLLALLMVISSVMAVATALQLTASAVRGRKYIIFYKHMAEHFSYTSGEISDVRTTYGGTRTLISVKYEYDGTTYERTIENVAAEGGRPAVPNAVPGKKVEVLLKKGRPEKISAIAEPGSNIKNRAKEELEFAKWFFIKKTGFELFEVICHVLVLSVAALALKKGLPFMWVCVPIMLTSATTYMNHVHIRRATAQSRKRSAELAAEHNKLHSGE